MIIHVYPDPADDASAGGSSITYGDVFEVHDGEDIVHTDLEIRDHPEVPLTESQCDAVIVRLGYARTGPWNVTDDHAEAPGAPCRTSTGCRRLGCRGRRGRGLTSDDCCGSARRSDSWTGGRWRGALDAGELYASTSQLAVLALAVSLAYDGHPVALGGLLAGLGPVHAAMVLRAVATAAGHLQLGPPAGVGEAPGWDPDTD